MFLMFLLLFMLPLASLARLFRPISPRYSPERNKLSLFKVNTMPYFRSTGTVIYGIDKTQMQRHVHVPLTNQQRYESNRQNVLIKTF